MNKKNITPPNSPSLEGEKSSTDEKEARNFVIREKKVSITQSDSPPVSPYVIRLEVEGQTASSPSPLTLGEREETGMAAASSDGLMLEDILEPPATLTLSGPIGPWGRRLPSPEKGEAVPLPEARPRGPASRLRLGGHLLRARRTMKLFAKRTKKSVLKPRKVLARRRIKKKLLPTPYSLLPAMRAAFTFAIVALLFTLPASGLEAYTRIDGTRDALKARGRQALESVRKEIISGSLLGALGTARYEFLEAQADLDRALGTLKPLLTLLPVAGPAYRSGKLLLDAGAHLTEAARIVGEGFATLTKTDPPAPLTNRLIHLEESLRAALPLIEASTLELKSVRRESLPEKVRGAISELSRLLHQIRAAFYETTELLPALQNFLGAERPRRLLIIFQNPHELRPTGGFIGSFALLDIDRGEIASLEVPGGGSYDLQGGLKENVIAPAPLHLIEPRWQFHDANWFPDFPTSAKKLAWFYEKSGGGTVDGVIALNATLIPQLLTLVGPIEMPSYGRIFTSENFISEVQKIVELEYDRVENRPKAVIGEVAPIILERLLELGPDKQMALLNVLGEAFRVKEVQLWSADAATEDAFRRADLAGELKRTDGDSLMVVSSNIAGGKSDAVMSTDIGLRTTIDTDGSVINRLEIKREHHGTKGELFTGVRNVAYLRIYVPLGSTLIETRGFEAPPAEFFDDPEPGATFDIDLRAASRFIAREVSGDTEVTEEFGRTVFGNWLQVDPGAEATAVITYRLPWKLARSDKTLAERLGLLVGLSNYSSYTMLVEKQSGLIANFNQTINFPSRWQIRWQNTGTAASGRLTVEKVLEADIFVGALFER